MMFKVYQTTTIVEADLLKAIFKERGIDVEIKNKTLIGLTGEIPFTEAYPEIWVSKNSDMELIQRTLNEYETSKKSKKIIAPWICESCNEENEGNFEICWQCLSTNSIN